MSQALAVRIVPRQEHLERQQRLNAGALYSLTREPKLLTQAKQASAQIVTFTPPTITREQAEREWAERQVALHKPVWPHQKKIPIALVQRVVAEDYGVSRDVMHVESRERDVARPRQVAMYLADKVGEWSLAHIALYFGGRNHTTVLHAKAKIAWLVGDREVVYKCLRRQKLPQEVDVELAARITRLRQEIHDRWALRLQEAS